MVHPPDYTRSLYDDSCTFSHITLHWMGPVIHDARVDKGFGVRNLYKLGRKTRSDVLYAGLAERYRADTAADCSLFHTYFSFLPRNYWLVIVSWVLFIVCAYSESIVIGLYLDHFDVLRTDPAYDRWWWGWVLVAIFVVMKYIAAFMYQISLVVSTRTGVRVRIAVTTLLYNKLLKMRESAKCALSSGNLTNLMFTDTSRIMTFTQNLHITLFLVIEIIGSSLLLARKLGIYTLIPVGILIVMVLMSIGMGALMMRFHQRAMTIADSRVRKTAEVLDGIRVTKLFGNEDILCQRLRTARRMEYKQIRRFSFTQATMFSIIDNIIPVICLVVYAVVARAEVINASIVYELAALINAMRNPFMYLPTCIVSIQDFLVAVRRISAFLGMPEKDTESFDIRDAEGRAPPDWRAIVLDPLLRSAEMQVLQEAHKSADIAAPMAEVISVPAPTSFTWASAEDRRVPPIVDQDFALKAAQEKKELQRLAGEVKALAAGRGASVKALWAEYKALVPASRLSEGARSAKSKGPATTAEASAFKAWLEAGPDAPVPVPKVPFALAPALRDITLTVAPGETIGICGIIGSGKSSLLAALLGELRVCAPDWEYETETEETVAGADLGIGPLAQGAAVHVRGRVAYCAQAAWIMNATVRENIVFGQPFDRAWYDEVCAKCCLLPDFAQFVAGDQTEIGEKGATLSGGQKHRVALARAVYSRADVYLLDDPLSAVDAHVGKRLFEDVICGLLRDKTVLLSTHQVQYLPRCTRCICLHGGRIKYDGAFDAEFMQGFLGEAFVNATRQAELAESIPTPATLPTKLPSPNEVSAEDVTEGDVEAEADSGRLVQDEEKAQGGVKMRTFWKYVKASGFPASIWLVLVVMLGAIAASVVSDAMLAEWSADPYGPASGEKFQWYVVSLVIVIALYFVIVFGLIAMSLHSSRNMHVDAIAAVMRAPMAFFDATPIGRILNRFSKDTDNTDYLVTLYLAIFLVFLVFLVQTIIVIGMANAYILIAVAVVLAAYLGIFARFRATPRELRRLDNITRSPVYSLTTETLAGATTIRAYEREADFTRLYFDRLDVNSTANYMYANTMYWLTFRFDCVGVLLILAMSVLGLVLYRNDTIAVMIGVGLSYSSVIPLLLRMTVLNFVNFEAEFSSCERLLEYRDRTPAERARASDPPLPETWPQTGELTFEHVALRYRPTLPLVLKDVTFHIASGEKVGIVGRTGAGKTSITAALFQLYECEEGSRIVLDGVDLTRAGLADVRHAVAIIPQDAFLFSGTLRENLDVSRLLVDEELAALGDLKPAKREAAAAAIVERLGLAGRLVAEDAMWDALAKCRLREAFEAKPGGLDFVLTDNGANLSAGERQLVCLAKALLLGCRVIVMDEATAQVDQESDALVQRIIRESFADRTILCIAHRLQTIIDFDRVLVMDDGRVAEFDTPAALLARDSLFGALVDETGPTNAALLRAIAAGERPAFEGA